MPFRVIAGIGQSSRMVCEVGDRIRCDLWVTPANGDVYVLFNRNGIYVSSLEYIFGIAVGIKTAKDSYAPLYRH